MDGFGQDSGVIVMAATNRLDVLDTALVRPGRFDRIIEVGAPEYEGRIEILKVCPASVPQSYTIMRLRLSALTIDITKWRLALPSALGNCYALTLPYEVGEAAMPASMDPMQSLVWCMVVGKDLDVP